MTLPAREANLPTAPVLCAIPAQGTALASYISAGDQIHEKNTDPLAK